MLKFATLQLSDAHLAEDAVQEALMGALKNAGSFRGEAALKTWVFAILKNKIADVLRSRQKFLPAYDVTDMNRDDDRVNSLFDVRGMWHDASRPTEWSNPEGAIESEQFWHVFDSCLEALPNNQARVFMMREFVEMETHEICAAVGITVSNLNVMLHRARLRLRDCLERHWFMSSDQKC